MGIPRRKQRVSQREAQIRRLLNMRDKSTYTPAYLDAFVRYRLQQRVGWWDLFPPKAPGQPEAMAHTLTDEDIFTQPMPKPALPPVFPKGPLNLNEDGKTISYRKSHMGPHAAQWEQADSHRRIGETFQIWHASAHRAPRYSTRQAGHVHEPRM